MLSKRLAKALEGPLHRVQKLELPEGRVFWLKRVEKLTGRMRLQKGDPSAAFEAEREGLRKMAELELPVPAIAAEGADYFVLPDVGPTLVQVANDKARSEPVKEAAFRKAGQALARVHQAGLSHGRPAVRDICWDGAAVNFIDLERFSQRRRSGFWQAMDVVIFAHSAVTQWPAKPRLVLAALQDWAKNAPEGAARRVALVARALTPLSWLARVLLRVKPKSRELRAVPLTIGLLSRKIR